jgi:hypothetical protein
MRFPGFTRFAALTAMFGLAGPGVAAAQTTPHLIPMATQPDPHDFMTRTDSQLYWLGNPIRFAGSNINELALRPTPQGLQIPTDYETDDLLATVGALGAGMVRTVSLGISAGCPECLLPAPGKLNPEALKRFDHLLRLAHNAGLRLFIPLAGGGDSCPAKPDPLRDTACIFARWHHLPPSAFYTDAAVRAEFTNAVTTLLNHVNVENGIVYRNDPIVAAWENCDGCGASVDPAIIADWTEALGRAIKSVDTRHLYENGAFAGRLATVGAGRLALPSVDILGDRFSFQPDAGPTRFAAGLDAVTNANRIYFIDSYDWTDATFRTPNDLQSFMLEIRLDRRLTGVFLRNLSGHAQNGGYLPAPANEMPPLYFPGFGIAGMDEASVRDRARNVRRLTFRMLDMLPLAYAQPNPPQIISAVHGKVTWRGSAGAADYSIERSSDITATGSWQTLCDQCATDLSPSWQDPNVPGTPVWYRMKPYNINGHIGMTSDPVANR